MIRLNYWTGEHIVESFDPSNKIFQSEFYNQMDLSIIHLFMLFGGSELL